VARLKRIGIGTRFSRRLAFLTFFYLGDSALTPNSAIAPYYRRKDKAKKPYITPMITVTAATADKADSFMVNQLIKPSNLLASCTICNVSNDRDRIQSN
jgi:hypothetical protein